MPASDFWDLPGGPAAGPGRDHTGRKLAPGTVGPTRGAASPVVTPRGSAGGPPGATGPATGGPGLARSDHKPRNGGGGTLTPTTGAARIVVTPRAPVVHNVHLDFETYSEADLPEVGSFRYAEDKSTEVLIACYAVDDGPVRVWCPFSKPAPQELIDLASDESVMFHAHNVGFEYAVWSRVLVKRHGMPPIPPHRWSCTAARAAAVGLPRSLGDVAKRLGLSEQKDDRGAELIKFFSMPQKARKNKPAYRNLPTEHRDKFKEFIDYCKQDVKTEHAVDAALPPLHPHEREAFVFDLMVNETGMPVDVDLLTKSEPVIAELEADVERRVLEITGGIRPTQRSKLIEWLNDNGCTLPDLTADTVNSVIDGTIYVSPDVKLVLESRLEASRASTKKLMRMRDCVCDDGRIRGVYMYAGAHTLRWSSKLVQMHNLKRGYDDPARISAVLEAFRSGDASLVRILYESPMEELSQCVRGFLRAPEGREFGVFDYSQIEARNVDWHAGNEEGLAEWSSGLDKYKLMAMKIYGIKTIEEVTSENRRIGKNAVLGCGFGMGAPAFMSYVAAQGGSISEDEAQLAINVYRESNPQVVKWWSDVENYCIAAIADNGKSYTLRHCTFEMIEHWLTITLPSGRRIWYPNARIVRTATKYGKQKEGIAFDGAKHTEHTYGGKIVENIVQATCRDVMFNGAVTAMSEGYMLDGHTHDELIFEFDEGTTDVGHMKRLICKPPHWLVGMPLQASGFVTKFYRKD